MLTPTKLLFIRLRQHVRYITKALNSVLDWSVWLYIVVPLLVVAIGLYADLWRQFPDWALNIGWEWIYIAIINLFLIGAKPFVGVAEADQLILLQHDRWYKVMKQWGLLYNGLMTIIRLALILIILLPFLVLGSGFTVADLLPLQLYSLGSTIMMYSISPYFYKRGKWWARLLRSSLRSLITVVIWAVPAYGYMVNLWKLDYIFIALLLVILGCTWRYFTGKLPFALQLQQEQEFRSNLTGILLSQVQEQKSTKRKKKPWIFRKSQRLFKSSDYVYTVCELRIKALLRSLSVLQVGLTIIASGSYAVFLVDGFGALVVVIGLVLVKRVWLHLQWEQWSKEQYLQLYLKDSEGTKRAKSLSTNLLTIPGLFIWLAIMVISL